MIHKGKILYSGFNIYNLFLQNALPSDDDDKDPNDPHKALDIDLDKYVTSVLHPVSL